MREFQLVTDTSEPSRKGTPRDCVGGAAPLFNEGFGICLGGRKYYLNVRVGVEARSRERLADEGQVRVSGVAFLYLVICSGAIMLFGTLCLLYLLKSALGIDFSPDHSILHPLMDLIGG